MAIHATKLHQPRPRANAVIRQRLLALLDRGLGDAHRLILVSAPAGYGKTTLLAHWLAARPCRIAWLSLDHEDDNPSRFWSCVIQALQFSVPGLAQPSLEALNSDVPPPLVSVLPNLLNEIEAMGSASGEHLVLVLDDYHVLTSRPVHESVASMVEHLPEHMHLAICTRADPPLPLARWRARDELTEVREADLRFTGEEALAFLNQRMELHLQIEDAERLVEHTEGWAVGLQLAALSLQGKADPEKAIQSLGGTQHFVLEYLLEEVLSRQPESTERFLLQTSILDRICGPLCDAVTGQGGGAATLAELQRQNLFVVPLDDERCWYRYHHLFAELLRARLQQTAPEQLPALHAAASAWFEANDTLAEALSSAVRHALAARDWDRAARLFEAREQEWWTGSDVGILGDLIVQQLPNEVINRRPILAIYEAWGLLLRGQLGESAALLEGAERNLTLAEANDENLSLLAFVALQRAYIDEFAARGGARRLGTSTVERVPEGRGGMRNSAEVILAYLAYRNGDFGQAERLLQATIERDRRTGATNGIPIAASRLGRMWMIQGRLQEVEELCRSCLAWVEARGKWRFYVAGNLNVMRGEVLREWNRLDEAETCIRQGIQDNEPWGIPHAYAFGYGALARVLLARGDLPGVTAALARLEDLISERTVPPDLVSEVRALKLRVAVATGDRDSVGRWEAEWARVAEAAPDFRGEHDRLSLARSLLVLGRPDAAGELLVGMVRSAALGGRLRPQAEILALLARAYSAKCQARQAAKAIDHSLAIAAPMGCTRLFLDEGPDMISLVAAAQKQGRLSPAVQEFANLILASTPIQPPQPSHRSGLGANADLVDPLTPREQEVLALLAAGCSNRDIAERLVVTVAAVKKHTGSIYGKMGVTNRTQAVLRARELGLTGAEK